MVTETATAGSGLSDVDRPPARSIWQRPGLWLGVFVAVFFAVSFTALEITYENLARTIGSLPIFMQALSATSHGYIPFYESLDCMGKSRCSFLLVHPGFVLYAIVPVYAAAPSPETLFAAESLVTALAAVPLFVLTRRLTGSSPKGLLAAGWFLLWAPLLGSTATSVDIEWALPLELFTVAALWVGGHYRWALAAAVVAFLTFELATVFAFLLGVFFLIPALVAIFGEGRSLWGKWRAGNVHFGPAVRLWFQSWARTLRLTQNRYAEALLVLAVAAYFLNNVFANFVGAGLLGAPAPPGHTLLSGLFYDPSVGGRSGVPLLIGSPGTLLHSSQSLQTVEYWVILYALLGFIPLLSRRALVLSVPWIVFTLLTADARYSTIGFYGSAFAAVPLFIGLAYGLGKIPPLLRRSTYSVRALDGARAAVSPDAGSFRLPRSSHPRTWMVLIGAALVANAVLSPIDPVLGAPGVQLGEPFAPGYYVSLTPPSTGLGALESMVATIPSAASVAAPAILAPFIINHVHAYVLTPRNTPQWNNQSRLPFNLTGGPDYVLVDGFGSYLPPALSEAISNKSVYGISGYVVSSPAGPVVLYDKGYSGLPLLFGPNTIPLTTAYGPGTGLIPGPVGRTVPARDGEPAFITNTSNGTAGGIVWTTPTFFLEPGTYLFSLSASVTSHASIGTSDPKVTVVKVSGFGGYYHSVTFYAKNFSKSSWTNLTMSLSTADPVLWVAVSGTWSNSNFSLAVSNIVVTRLTTG